MGRSPCCEKMGMKKGPWTREEDVILVNYINENGHDNWRALPKRAGLLRCGKSCRLRWLNYLRPDIKRGNFTKEEEETVIKLHQQLGNRWSVIAAKLPGRTDNEIKNVWHTTLKKKSNKPIPETHIHMSESFDFNPKAGQNSDLSSPQHSSSDASFPNADMVTDSLANFSEIIDESFWSTDFSAGDNDYWVHFPMVTENQIQMTESLDFNGKVNQSSDLSPQHSSGEVSSVDAGFSSTGLVANSLDNFPGLEDSLWSDVFSTVNGDFPVQFSMDNTFGSEFNMFGGNDIWNDMFINQ